MGRPLPRILVASSSFGRGADRDSLQALFRRHGYAADFRPLAEAIPRLGDYVGLVLGTERADSCFFERATNLKAVIKYGVGTDNIDTAAAAEHGVRVLNLPGVNAETVAEMALGLMLAAARRIAQGDRVLRRGSDDRPLGVPVVGRTLGVVGTGAIGSRLVSLAKGLRMTILAHDLREDDSVIAAGGRYVTLEELLARADFVSVHLPLNDRTFHRIGAAELALMKPSACLVNTSRGAVVHEQALYAALLRGRPGAAALDVFETSPARESPLLTLENVVCTPHLGAYTDETLRRMDAACVEALCAAVGG
jgi:D-3-phosphoglycerate dehydrogenase